MSQFFKNKAGEIIRVADRNLGNVDENEWTPVAPQEAYQLVAGKEEQKYQDKYGGTLGQLRLGAEKAFDGFTGGVATGLVYDRKGQQDLARAARENPGVAVTGEIAGMLGPGSVPSLVTKGVAKAALKTGLKGVARDVVEGGVANVAVNSLHGLGQIANDAQIAKAEPLTWEQRGADLAEQFLVGGVLNTVAGGIGKAFGTVGQKLFGKTLSNKLNPAASLDDLVEKETGAILNRPAAEMPMPPMADEVAQLPVMVPRPTPKFTSEVTVNRRMPVLDDTVKRVPQGLEDTIPRAMARSASKVEELPAVAGKATTPLGAFLRQKGEDAFWNKLMDSAGDIQKSGHRKEELMGALDRAGILGSKFTADTFPKVVQKIEIAAQGEGAKMGEVLQAMDQKSKPQMGEIFSKLETDLKSKFAAKNADTWQAAKKELGNLSSVLAEQNKQGVLTWDSLRKYRGELGYDPMNSAASEARAALSAGIRDAIESEAGQVLGKRAANQYKLANNEFERLKKVQGLAEGVANKNKPATSWEVGKVGNIGLGMAGALTGNPFLLSGGALTGAAVAAKQITKRLPLIEQQLFAKMGNAVDATADALRSRLTTAIVNQVGGGKYYATMMAMQDMDNEELLHAHAALASSSAGPEYMATLGVDHELSPEQHEQFNNQLVAAQRNKEIQQQTEDGISRAAAVFVGQKVPAVPKTSPLGPGAPMLPEENLNARKIGAQLRNLDMEQTYSKLAGRDWSTDPGTNAQVAANAAQRLSFLKSKVPYEAPATALRPAVKASQAEWDKFNRYLKAARPGGFLKALESGHITAEDVEAVKALEPELYSRIGSEVYNQATRLKTLPYKKRLQLQLIIGPSALNLTSSQVNLMQQVHHDASQPLQVKGPDGRQRVDVQENMATQAQRLENRGAK